MNKNCYIPRPTRPTVVRRVLASSLLTLRCRLLRLRTLYMSDDARDLVAIVGERYKEDVARFGYVFPANSSAPTMRT